MKEFLQKALRLETLLWILLVLGIEHASRIFRYLPFAPEFFRSSTYTNGHVGTFVICTTLICLTYLKVNKPKE